MNRRNARWGYGIAFFAIFAIEILIALFLDDPFIRPYGGDILVTVLICCFCRIFFPEWPKLLPLWVFLFAVAVEVGQYFDFVTLLGLGSSTFFRILLGTSFSWLDLLCYAAGGILFVAAELLLKKKHVK